MGHLNLTPNSDPLIWPAINDLPGDASRGLRE
jgi:hypothetical protein